MEAVDYITDKILYIEKYVDQSNSESMNVEEWEKTYQAKETENKVRLCP